MPCEKQSLIREDGGSHACVHTVKKSKSQKVKKSNVKKPKSQKVKKSNVKKPKSQKVKKSKSLNVTRTTVRCIYMQTVGQSKSQTKIQSDAYICRQSYMLAGEQSER